MSMFEAFDLLLWISTACLFAWCAGYMRGMTTAYKDAKEVLKQRSNKP